jgi:hypothetical protein
MKPKIRTGAEQGIWLDGRRAMKANASNISQLTEALRLCFNVLDDTGCTKNSPIREAWKAAKEALGL